jgi:carbamoyl-phosphate synthase large subunit
MQDLTPWGYACRLLLGARLDELGLPARAVPARAWAKEAVFPAERFPNAANRGPEMRSTGEVMASGLRSPPPMRALRAAGRSHRGGSIGPALQAQR